METARDAGSAPPDCAASSTLRATLALPLAVAAASAEAMLALGAETVMGTTICATVAGEKPYGAPEMLAAHAAGKPWSRTSAACVMLMSA
jgi:hypothetical protein